MADVAIVTGGTGSIGGAIASVLQSRGMHVVAADVDVRPVSEGQSFFECDVTRPDSVAALFNNAAQFGDITCLVAAHGILMETPAGTANLATVKTILDVNLNSVAYLCEFAGARLASNSSILLISSVTAFMGRIKGAYAYQASKAGVESLTRAFAVAYGPRGIRVNAIAPGFMTLPVKGEGAVLRARQGGSDAVSKMTPLGRMVDHRELAHAAAFLCSTEAAAITGVLLPVDCGLAAL